MKFKRGDKVRVINNRNNHGRVGIIVRIDDCESHIAPFVVELYSGSNWVEKYIYNEDEIEHTKNHIIKQRLKWIYT